MAGGFAGLIAQIEYLAPRLTVQEADDTAHLMGAILRARVAQIEERRRVLREAFGEEAA